LVENQQYFSRQSEFLEGNPREFLEFEQDPKLQRSSSGLTRLHYAANKGDLNQIKLLIKAISIDDQQSSVKLTPLYVAMLAGQVKAMKLLLNLGANINLATGGKVIWTLTPLLLAVLLGNKAMVKLLLQQKEVNIWARDFGFMSATAAHYAAEGRVCRKCDNKILAMLLDHDRTLAFAKDLRKRTPLHRAAVVSNLDGVKQLLKAGANINALDIGHQTPLHRAYASANGLQGAQQACTTEEMIDSWQVLGASKEEIATMSHTKQVFFNVNSLRFDMQQAFDNIYRIFRGSKDNVIPDSLMLPAYENVVNETPPDHDPFLLCRRDTMIKYSPTDPTGIIWVFKAVEEMMLAKQSNPSLP
jgi:ankyrin repeat protein